ncbi:MAG: polysaccharide biosynthesis/export family protein [Myxococcales bacterium]|nr:polysaccharide biosynthesis/export family protein [Myxococcales bacterium]
MRFETDERFAQQRRPASGLASMRGLALAGLVLIVAAAGCAITPEAPPASTGYETYRVGAPDTLLITVLPDPTIERQAVVRPDGMISIDLVGDVPAGGRTVEEIAADVEKRIGRFKRGASVTVAVVLARSSSVTLLGEVGGNRSMALLKETRIAEAIGQAGGLNRFANVDRIRVIRHMGGQTHVYHVNLGAIQNGDLSTNMLLAGGDIIYAPPTIWARVGHALNALLYPLQPFLGFGTSLAGSAASKGLGI